MLIIRSILKTIVLDTDPPPAAHISMHYRTPRRVDQVYVPGNLNSKYCQKPRPIICTGLYRKCYRLYRKGIQDTNDLRGGGTREMPLTFQNIVKKSEPIIYTMFVLY